MCWASLLLDNSSEDRNGDFCPLMVIYIICINNVKKVKSPRLIIRVTVSKDLIVFVSGLILQGWLKHPLRQTAWLNWQLFGLNNILLEQFYFTGANIKNQFYGIGSTVVERATHMQVYAGSSLTGVDHHKELISALSCSLNDANKWMGKEKQKMCTHISVNLDLVIVNVLSVCLFCYFHQFLQQTKDESSQVWVPIPENVQE